MKKLLFVLFLVCGVGHAQDGIKFTSPLIEVVGMPNDDGFIERNTDIYLYEDTIITYTHREDGTKEMEKWDITKDVFKSQLVNEMLVDSYKAIHLWDDKVIYSQWDFVINKDDKVEIIGCTLYEDAEGANPMTIRYHIN